MYSEKNFIAQGLLFHRSEDLIEFSVIFHLSFFNSSFKKIKTEDLKILFGSLSQDNLVLKRVLLYSLLFAELVFVTFLRSFLNSREDTWYHWGLFVKQFRYLRFFIVACLESVFIFYGMFCPSFQLQVWQLRGIPAWASEAGRVPTRLWETGMWEGRAEGETTAKSNSKYTYFSILLNYCFVLFFNYGHIYIPGVVFY